ncbi:MAG: dihydrolipoyl dehydrogenase [Vicinamibacterales bacterium]
MSNSPKIAVIGAGPGGYAAAFYAADLGMDVTLVDAEKNPGGVCLYRGCIPSKALLHVAKLLEEADHASEWGIDFGKPKVDVNKLRAYKDRVVEKLTSGTGQVAKLRKIRYLQGRATLTGPTRFTVALAAGGEEAVEVDDIILATGSSPTRIPSLSLDSPRVLDSTGALDLPEVPKTMLVVGGGYIGLELGSVYAALGAKVSVVEMTPGLLPGADRDLVKILAQRVEKTFDKVMLATKVTSMKEAKKGITVSFEGEGAPASETYDYVLVSIGRRPNGHVPGLETTRVQVTDKGFIETDGQRRTAEPTVFAIGDVAGEPMLAHKASHEARVAVEAIAGHKAIFEPLAIPAVVFTDPEVAWAGLTEADAEKQGIEVEVARFPWGASGRAISIDRVDGLTKILVDPKTERVLGVGIVGSGAGELIAEATLAIEMGATVSDLKLTIHAHPTLSETVMEAAEVFFGQATHVYKPRRK